jgi:hypothetical protein
MQTEELCPETPVVDPVGIRGTEEEWRLRRVLGMGGRKGRTRTIVFQRIRRVGLKCHSNYIDSRLSCLWEQTARSIQKAFSVECS